jgi:hypothetical protein
MIPHYPKGMSVKLNPPEWVSQHEAAKDLGIRLVRIGVLISNDHLEPAENTQCEMGVSRNSLEVEKRWRNEAPRIKKMLRPFVDVFKWF